MVKTLANALRHLVSLVEDLSLRHVTARVAKILLDQEASAQEGHHVYHLTQQEMAVLAGTAREVVGRALKELEAAGHAILLSRERLPCSPQESKGSPHFSGRGASVEDRFPAFQA